ncbi:hypothetical protein G7K_1967-t1 [Saitoella complicata NRRL Y-17804]|uniref:Uncharacterized protein n=1 Tax=Saitoella complicata (strain BCRC 22490 / CBS 7301 / JCM 7358 / NBRC 10748 / NRRL Y-17804) TaxID=698492 RepID=A0A0E9ND86_SAICN|nr:hypothetical protein G7K_1967-t1 [Saitoella complicata NRRL Y-17804]
MSSESQHRWSLPHNQTHIDHNHNHEQHSTATIFRSRKAQTPSYFDEKVKTQLHASDRTIAFANHAIGNQDRPQCYKT